MRRLVVAGGVSPELMVLSIGAGSLMCSHVNDSGFWMFKEYFGLSLKDTFRSWTLMETLVGVFGLLFVLLLSMFLLLPYKIRGAYQDDDNLTCSSAHAGAGTAAWRSGCRYRT